LKITLLWRIKQESEIFYDIDFYVKVKPFTRYVKQEVRRERKVAHYQVSLYTFSAFLNISCRVLGRVIPVLKNDIKLSEWR